MRVYRGFNIPEIMPEIMIGLMPGMHTPEVIILNEKEHLRLSLPITREALTKLDFSMDTLITEAVNVVDAYLSTQEV